MQRTPWIFGLTLGALLVTGATTPQLVAQDDLPDEFQNLQLLDEDISKEDLKALMTSFTEQLGVKCTFCHELGEYHLDDKKHKKIARKMIGLVTHMRENLDTFFADGTEINQVACWTCHRGEAEIEEFSPEEEDADWQ